jgi:exodeoxyribonuclease V gamma subunit
MIVGWEKGEVGQKDEKWQADLWRELVRDRGNHHPAAYRDCFFRKISSDSFSVAASLPERIAVFGISALPRFYLEIIYA